MDSWNNHFVAKCYEGVYASLYGLMTSNIENPLMDHLFL